MNGAYLALAARVTRTVDDLAAVVTRAERQLGHAQRQSDDSYLDAAALNLHGFCTGVERIFEDIARTLDTSVPTGADGHRTLLRQMSASLDPIRPAVIRVATRNCLEEYRSFRHVVRNVYTFNLHPERVAELTERLRDFYAMVQADLSGFADNLRRIATA